MWKTLPLSFSCVLKKVVLPLQKTCNPPTVCCILKTNRPTPLLTIRNSPFVLRYNAMRPLTLPQMEQQLEQLHDSMLVLSCKDSGLVIGAVFFSPDRMRYQTGSLCLSYYLGESWCRQGYMSEALAALIPQLFSQGAQLLCARCFSPNTASRALLVKLGFRLEGCLRHAVLGYGGIIYDDCLYSILKEEF